MATSAARLPTRRCHKRTRRSARSAIPSASTPSSPSIAWPTSTSPTPLRPSSIPPAARRSSSRRMPSTSLLSTGSETASPPFSVTTATTITTTILPPTSPTPSKWPDRHNSVSNWPTTCPRKPSRSGTSATSPYSSARACANNSPTVSSAVTSSSVSTARIRLSGLTSS